MGELAGALVDHDAAIRLDPKDAAVFYNRRNARHDTGDLAAAILDHGEAAVRHDVRAEARLPERPLPRRPMTRRSPRGVSSACSLNSPLAAVTAGFSHAFVRNRDCISISGLRATQEAAAIAFTTVYGRSRRSLGGTVRELRRAFNVVNEEGDGAAREIESSTLGRGLSGLERQGVLDCL